MPLPHLGVVAVTGHEEASQVYREAETFSSYNSVVGQFALRPDATAGAARRKRPAVASLG